MMKDVLSVLDMKDDLEDLVTKSVRFKRDRYSAVEGMHNKVLGMIFEKPSTRTRTSLETAMVQMGGHAIYLNPNDMQLGRGETVEDTGKVLSRLVDVISYRAFSHEKMVELARSSSVPVINALDDLEHPLQIVADFATILEKKGRANNLKFSYVGDGNNMCNSLILASAILGTDISVARPRGYGPNQNLLDAALKIAKETSSRIEILEDPVKAVEGSDIIYTDVWVSMGEEKERAAREKLFMPYQVNSDLCQHADKNYIFMHCLPAHRGLEVSAEIADGVHSVIFDEAEYRLHSSKAVISSLLSV
ncbi:MAG: ornithine carbamoyltransferase [Candidatus Thermoplasmatota archaeon]|nr:ornithine carbamoyltransferase [Candidatus Thermoplasmatota archaeon]